MGIGYFYQEVFFQVQSNNPHTDASSLPLRLASKSKTDENAASALFISYGLVFYLIALAGVE